MKEDYHKALELIFAYGYECCAFKHNIYGDWPEITDSLMLPTHFFLEFFVKPRCPLAPVSLKSKAVEADLGGAAENLEGDVVAME